MKKQLAWVLPVIFIIIALVVASFFDRGDDISFSSFTTSQHGASLLHDTLQHLGMPVRQSRRPLTQESCTNSVYVLIQPHAPRITPYIAEEMLEWVRDGGRLIFLCTTHPYSVFSHALGRPAQVMGDFALYRVGDGEVVTGRSRMVTNGILMNDHTHGQAIYSMLLRWDGEREIENIFFGEYYHGFHIAENFIGGLPLVIRLVLAQFVILAVVMVWHLGKRFGNPVPAYEEIEREENEYVRALARLYMKVDK